MADKKQTMLYGLLTSIASKITYDNTTSGLEADNVQDAIDEVNSNLGMVKEQCSGANFINNPYVYKNGQFCVVSLAAQLKAGSYASLQSLAQLPFTPAGTFITIAMFGGSTTPIRVDTNGAISFNETHNVSSPDWIIGELVYISEN